MCVNVCACEISKLTFLISDLPLLDLPNYSVNKAELEAESYFCPYNEMLFIEKERG